MSELIVNINSMSGFLNWWRLHGPFLLLLKGILKYVYIYTDIFCAFILQNTIQFNNLVFLVQSKTPDLGHYLRGCIDTQWWKKAFFGLKISLKVSECSLFQCGYQHESLTCCTCTAPSRPGLNVSARRRPSQ